MPKRRRNRRNRKNAPNNEKAKECEVETVKASGTTPLDRNKTIPPTISITNLFTPKKQATPSPKINNNAVQFHRAIPSTPVNHQRSFRSRIAEEETPIYSNINLLFNLENNTPVTVKSSPIRVNVATQTVYFNNNSKTTRDVAVQFDNENLAITETPKINQLHLLDEIETTPKSLLHISVNDQKLHSFEKIDCYKKNTVVFNVNPYVRNKEVADVSFFSAHFDNLKLASTPISHVALTPKSEVQALKNEIIALKKRCYKSVSPKINRYVNHTKYCNKSHNISLLRQKSPLKNSRRISIEESEKSFVINNSSNGAIGARLYSKIRKYGRYTAKWSMKLIELCWELGITIRKVFVFFVFCFWNCRFFLFVGSFCDLPLL